MLVDGLLSYRISPLSAITIRLPIGAPLGGRQSHLPGIEARADESPMNLRGACAFF
jgi:hypothetical protein